MLLNHYFMEIFQVTFDVTEKACHTYLIVKKQYDAPFFFTIQFYVVYRIKSIYLQLNKAYSDRCPIVVIVHASFHLLHFIQSHDSSLFLSCWFISLLCYSRNISRLWTRLFLVFRSLFPGQSGEAILVLVGWIFWPLSQSISSWQS